MAGSVVAFVAACISVSTALAQPPLARPGVPDFDHRRAGLPDNGACYAAPAAALNWLAWLNDHGYPGLLGAPCDWQSQDHHAEVTAAVAELAALMGLADAPGLPPDACGPSIEGYGAGLQAWLDARAPGHFTVSTLAATGGYAPSPAQLRQLLAAGSMVNIVTARWTLAPADPGAGLPERYVPAPARHVLTLTRVEAAASNSPVLWLRDPAGDDGDPGAQSAFTSRRAPLTPLPAWFAPEGFAPAAYRTAYRFAGVPDQVLTLDAALLITPTFAVSAEPLGAAITLTGLTHPRSGAPSAPVQVALPDGWTAESIATDAGVCAAVIARNRLGQRALWRLDLGTRAWSFLRMLIEPGPMVFDGAGRLHIYTGNLMLRLDVSTAPPLTLGMVALPARPDAAAYDDGSRRIYTLFRAETGACVVRHIGETCQGEVVTETLPASVTVAGTPSLAIDPVAGCLFLAGAESDLVYALRRNRAGADAYIAEPIAHPSLAAGACGLHVDHRRHLFFVSGGQVHELEFVDEPAQYEYVAAADSMLCGQSAGDVWCMPVCRRGQPPAGAGFPLAYPAPAAPPALGPALIECAADFDGDGLLTVPDIFAFLAAWFAGDVGADRVMPIGPDAADLFSFLTDWFGGC